MQGMMIHCGGHAVAREALNLLPTPENTKTHFPIPHGRLLSEVGTALEGSGLRIVEEEHAIAKGSDRYFGLLRVANGTEHSDYCTMLGLRNSHDKSFPAMLALGSRVFVCDNLAFSGEIQIARKHTRNILRDLNNLIMRAVGGLGNLRAHQDRRIDAYKNSDMTDVQANDFLVRSVDARVLPVTKLPRVLAEWREPSHPEFSESRNAWRLFNAYTEVQKGTNIFNLPRTSQALHGMMDSFCGLEAHAN